MSDLLEHISFAVQMDVAHDEQIGEVREEENIEFYVLGEQQRLEIIIAGGEQNPQSPQDDDHVSGFQNVLPFRSIWKSDHDIESIYAENSILQYSIEWVIVGKEFGVKSCFYILDHHRNAVAFWWWFF